MSTVDLVPEQRYECALEECDQERTPSTSIAGSYCSDECAARAAGRALLQDIEQDHRFCWSCFRQRKSIERPTAEAKRGRGRWTAEAMVGFEYATEHVDMGPYGLECTCGAVDHDLDWTEVRDRTPFHWYLGLASRQLVADGRRDDAVDVAELADQLWLTDDLELSVGRALR
ncbi:hypothetical protein [Halovenus marina]|uniref:hypothetical protein n=1 Tax=Halovenus marina TaxID=3396621 RepID=UPI003F55CD1E